MAIYVNVKDIRRDFGDFPLPGDVADVPSGSVRLAIIGIQSQAAAMK